MPRTLALLALTALVLLGCNSPKAHTKEPDLAQTLFLDARDTDQIFWIERHPDGNGWSAVVIPDLDARRSFLMRRLLGGNDISKEAGEVRYSTTEELGAVIQSEGSHASTANRLAVLYPYRDVTSDYIDQYCNGSTVVRTELTASK